jgi:hypothetical protein
VNSKAVVLGTVPRTKSGMRGLDPEGDNPQGTSEHPSFGHSRETCPRESGERDSTNLSDYWIPASAGMTYTELP